jgi:hypothetical protein
MPIPKNLNKAQDKKYHFAWLHKDGKYHVNEILLRGYKLVNKSEFPQIEGDPRIRADGCVEHGDSILGFCDFDEYKERKQAEDKTRQNRIINAKRAYHNQTRREGVPTFEEDRPGQPGQRPRQAPR